MKTKIRSHFTCVKCKQEKIFHNFDIHYSGDWDEAYVKRICRGCDKGDRMPETAALRRELQREMRKMAAMDEKREQLKCRIDELRGQIRGSLKNAVTTAELDMAWRELEQFAESTTEVCGSMEQHHPFPQFIS